MVTEVIEPGKKPYFEIKVDDRDWPVRVYLRGDGGAEIDDGYTGCSIDKESIAGVIHVLQKQVKR
jgi:hypothetical protein